MSISVKPVPGTHPGDDVISVVGDVIHRRRTCEFSEIALLRPCQQRLATVHPHSEVSCNLTVCHWGEPAGAATAVHDFRTHWTWLRAAADARAFGRDEDEPIGL